MWCTNLPIEFVGDYRHLVLKLILRLRHPNAAPSPSQAAHTPTHRPTPSPPPASPRLPCPFFIDKNTVSDDAMCHQRSNFVFTPFLFFLPFLFRGRARSVFVVCVCMLACTALQTEASGCNREACPAVFSSRRAIPTS